LKISQPSFIELQPKLQF